MPPVKKPKTQQIKKASPIKKPSQSENVVSGQLKKKLEKAKRKPKEGADRGVVFIKHLPHGFFEEQLRKYFEQFGRVTRLRLGRSRRTGGSKGFAFVEFQYPEVAKVAAETMDNYLMFQKVVKAAYIPPDAQKFNYFKSSVRQVTNKAGKDIFISSKTKAILRRTKKQNDWDEAAYQKRTDAGLKKLKQMQKKYEHLGVDFSGLLVQPVKKSKDSGVTSTEKTANDGQLVKAKKTNLKQKKLKAEPKLEDLLGNTINDDSSGDEDYVDIQPSDEGEEELEYEDTDSSDDEEMGPQLEDLLGDTINDDSEDEDFEDTSSGSDETEEETDGDADSSDEEGELPIPPPAKKSQKKIKGVDRIDQLLKRKPGAGGVQKKKIVNVSKKTSAATQKLKVAAAKVTAIPLQKVKSKKLKK